MHIINNRHEVIRIVQICNWRELHIIIVLRICLQRHNHRLACTKNDIVAHDNQDCRNCTEIRVLSYKCPIFESGIIIIVSGSPLVQSCINR